MALQHTYRPDTLDKIIGNEATVDSLKKQFERKKNRPQALLITGPSGCGKTTFARIIKELVKCHDMGFREIDASTDRGIDSIRKLKSTLPYAPMKGKSKVILLDECAGITPPAQEAMLKMLEDTPKDVYFILCTTEPEKLKITIKRRCHEYKVQPLDDAEMKKLLKTVCKKEKVEYSKKVGSKIIKTSNGSPGQALKLLDQVIEITNSTKALALLNEVTVSETQVIELCRTLLSKDNQKDRWKEMARILKGLKGEPESFRYAVMGYLNSVMLNNPNDRVAEISMCFLDSFMYTSKLGLTIACYTANKA